MVSAAEVVSRTAERIDAGSPPDVLLLDWRLGDSDALSALSDLVELVSATALPPTLIISGFDTDYLAHQPHAEYVSRILAKPVDPSDLFNAVSEAVAGRGRDRAAGTTTMSTSQPGAQLTGVHVLVVDDSELNLVVARRILELHGAQVTTCTSGQAALDLLTTNETHVDAVLLDIQMPAMDGNEVARRLRAAPQTADLPLIALTAGALVTEREKSMAAGMNAFLTKPFDPQDLVSTVRSLATATNSDAFVEPGDPPVGSHATGRDDALGQDFALGQDIAGIDAQIAARSVGNDAELFGQLLTMLLTDYQPPVVLPGMLTAESRDNLGALMHRLRGAAAMLGAEDVSEAAGEAESACRDGATDHVIVQAVDRARAALADLAVAAAEVLPPAIAREAAEPDVSGAAATFTDTTASESLLAELRLSSLSALETVDIYADALTNLLGASGYAQLRGQVRALEFQAATATLGAALGAAAPLPPAASAPSE